MSVEGAQTGERSVYFGPQRGWQTCPVYNRGLLPLEQAIEGPLLVEEATATTLVLDGQTVTVTNSGIILIHEQKAQAL